MGARGIIKFLKTLWVDEEGQSTTEYILILAIVVMIAVRFKKLIGEKINTATEQIGNQILDATRDLGSQ